MDARIRDESWACGVARRVADTGSRAGKVRRAIKRAASPRLSACTRVKIGIVALARRGEQGLEQLQALLESVQLDVVSVSDEQAKPAIDAFRPFGKGRHPAGLNFGDCFSHALAKATGEPLLFKGDDSARTDVRRAL